MIDCEKKVENGCFEVTLHHLFSLTMEDTSRCEPDPPEYSARQRRKIVLWRLFHLYPLCWENGGVFLSPRQESDLSLSRDYTQINYFYSIYSLIDFLYKCWNSFHSPASLIHHIAIHSCISNMGQKQTSMFPRGLGSSVPMQTSTKTLRMQSRGTKTKWRQCCIFFTPHDDEMKVFR